MSRRTAPSSEGLDEQVPKGTVQSRTRRLQRLAENGSRPQPSPVSDRERDGERFGWGTRSGLDAQFAQPATHSKAIEVRPNMPGQFVPQSFQHPLPSRYPSIGSSDPPSPRTVKSILSQMSSQRRENMPVPESEAASTITSRPSPPPVTVSPRFPMSPPRLQSSSTEQESGRTTPTGRREAARALFDEYGISRPSG